MLALLAVAGYVAPAACQSCHPQIYETYRQTGMGQSVSKIETVEPGGSFYHAPSQRHYSISRRDGQYFVRRHQTGFQGAVDNVVEKQIHYVIGSGRHARSYIHRTEQGRLVELPVSWYPAGGGRWAMSPGYDRPDHQDFRREISQECLFCHAGQAASTGQLEAIDCQRCHGPGADHVKAATERANPEALRASIVNPARLSPRRQMEVCLQCHLETTSRTLPNYVRRYDRPVFSYRPGEPLEDYAIHFDHAAGSGRNDKFEVNHAGYRLRKSRCYIESQGSMTCTTCHDPHRARRGAEAIRHYSAACRSCHSAGPHTRQQECVSCHMMKRRAEDAVHMVMTDHRIERNPTAKPQPEYEKEGAYTGVVELHYPPDLPDTPVNRFYRAVAQVKDFSNLAGGIPLLEKAIAETRPEQAEFYFDLAEAYWKTNQFAKAIEYYQQAIRRKPDYARAYHNLGEVLLRTGETLRATSILEQGLKMAPGNPELLDTLGVAYGQTGRTEDAVRVLSRAVEANPDRPMAWVNLGVALEQKQDAAGAEAAYRTAIRIQPDFAFARRYLSNLLRCGTGFLACP